MTATTSRRMTLADAAQDVVDSARYETECYVTVNRIDDLEACIPEQRAIEAATRELLTAIRAERAMLLDRWDGNRDEWFTPETEALYAAADALETLIGVPS